MSTRTIVFAGVLLAVSLLLAITGLGYFPVPNVTQSATILHVPAIIGGVLEGPVVGLIVGVVFGIDAFVKFGGLFAGNTVGAIITLILPRLLIGVVAYWVYKALRGGNQIVALVLAAIAGTLTNTILVIAFGVIFGVLPPAMFVAAIPQALFEAAIAVVITVAVVSVVRGVAGSRKGSTV